MRTRSRRLLVPAAVAAILPVTVLPTAPPPRPTTALVRATDGMDVEGTPAAATLTFAVEGADRTFALADVLSLHRGTPAAAAEATRIEHGLAALAGTDRAAAEAAAEDLVDVGLPALTPLLESFADTDAHEPDLRYRLFARLVPGRADGRDRSLDLLRLADGTVLRGTWRDPGIAITAADGTRHELDAAQVRRLAVRRATIAREFELQALHDCTYVSFFDTGVLTAKGSALEAYARGFVRLSFAEDGWATGPDGLHETLPGKRKLQEGFRWGAVLGRVGCHGERWLAGEHIEKPDLTPGHLYFVVNDNEHWQNNIGSYRVNLTVRDAYDIGDAR